MPDGIFDAAFEMAWMLLIQRMPDDRSNRVTYHPLALAGSLVVLLLVSSAAWGQTGFSTTRLATHHDGFTGLQAKPEHLSHLDGQPELEKHLARINQFRSMFHEGDKHADHGDTPLSPTPLSPTPLSPIRPASATVVPRAGPAPETDVADLAILELEDSMSSREYPSAFYPGVGLVFALKTISRWSEESMIRALKTGAVPIYNQSGDVIGVKDSTTGLLLGGRRS